MTEHQQQQEDSSSYAEPTASYEAVQDMDDDDEVVEDEDAEAMEGGGGTLLVQEEDLQQTPRLPTTSTFGNHSLASAATTPPMAKFLLPLLALLAHGLFIYGQTASMWRLSLTAEDISVYANATTTSAKMAFDTLGFDHHLHYQLEQNHTIQTFTYGHAVQELWEAKGMPGVVLPRIAAILLVLFSGIWPHVKLVWLNCTWFRSTTPRFSLKRRSRTLNWLATLGKWSLADVLTVCVMVGVLHLEWIIDPPTIQSKAMDHLPTIAKLISSSYSNNQICDWALPKDCSRHASAFDKFKCSTCKRIVGDALKNPESFRSHVKPVMDGIKTNGGGQVELSVVGMSGIYFFCAAVILSVLLSVLVDMYHLRDVEQKRQHYYYRRSHHREEPTGPTEDNTVSSIPTQSVQSAAAALSGDELSEASEPLLRRDSSLQPPQTQQQQEQAEQQPQPEPMELDEGSVFTHPVVARTTNYFSQIKHVVHIPALATLIVVAVAVYTPSMQRQVTGAIPMLLRDILGVQFNKAYSLQTLSDTTGAAGGMDLMLMATFSIFCVAGPLVRAVLIVILHILQFQKNPNHMRIRMVLSKTILFLGAFCAWEVFMTAMAMVELLMPSITDTILNTPFCQHVASDHGGSCLQVSFARRHVFYGIVVGFVLLVVMTNYQQYVMQQERNEYHDANAGGVPYVVLNNNNSTTGDGGYTDDDEEDHPLRLQQVGPGQLASQDSRQRLIDLAAAMEEDSRHGTTADSREPETEIV